MRWAARARLLAIPTLCAFLSFAFVVIRPWSDIAGDWAFLVYTSNLIFFFPRGRIGPQVEATVLGVLGGTFGLAWSSATLAIAAYCGRTYGVDSAYSRAILGLGLASLCFIAGLARSYSRRLNAASKITLFFPIFLLTSQQGITQMTAALFLQQFYVVVLSAAFALLPTLLLASHHPTNQLGNQINETVRITCELLPLSISTLLDLEKPSASDSSAERGRTLEKAIETQDEPPLQSKLAKQLKAMVSGLQATSAAFVQDARLLDRQATSLSDTIKAIGRLQRNPLLGPTSHVPGERIQAALHKTHRRRHSSHSRSRSIPHARSIRRRLDSAESDIEYATHRRPSHHITNSHLHSVMSAELDEDDSVEEQPDLRGISHQLVTVIIEALWLVDTQLAEKYGWPKAAVSKDADVAPRTLADAKRDLEDVLTQLQCALGDLLGASSSYDQQGDEITEQPQNREGRPDHITFSQSKHVTNVLRSRDRFRLAFYMTALLDLSRDIHGIVNTVMHASTHERSVVHWAGRIRLLWAKRRPGMYEEGDARDAQELSTAEGQRPYDQTKELEDMDFVTATLHQSRHGQVRTNTLGEKLNSFWRIVWDRPDVLKRRVTLSRLAHSITHSRHVRFSSKLTFGITMLSLPALLPPGNAGRTWYDTSRGGWMVVSYMFVSEDTTGVIMKVGFLRGLGTFIGAVMGYICSLIARENPYGLVVLATACTLPISWNILFTSIPGLGTSIGITLPPVMFIPYLGLANGQSDFTLAWYRFTDIIIGIAAAVLVGTWIWPVHARVQYFREVSNTMEEITEFYLRMSRDNLRSSLVYQVDDKQYDRLEAKVKRDFQLARALVSIQRQEISLLPRPFKLYSEIIDAIERLLEALVEIRLLRFSVPRKANVLDVLPIRRELVSNVLINLWACAHAFGSRSPLPQFLPAPREPLAELMRVTDEHVKEIRSQRHSHSRSRAYFPASSVAVTPPSTPTRSGTPSGTRDGFASPSIQTQEQAAETYRTEMSVLYAMAEQEALGEVCNILDELVAAARTLFGTQTFLGAL